MGPDARIEANPTRRQFHKLWSESNDRHLQLRESVSKRLVIPVLTDQLQGLSPYALKVRDEVHTTFSAMIERTELFESIMSEAKAAIDQIDQHDRISYRFQNIGFDLKSLKKLQESDLEEYCASEIFGKVEGMTAQYLREEIDRNYKHHIDIEKRGGKFKEELEKAVRIFDAIKACQNVEALYNRAKNQRSFPHRLYYLKEVANAFIEIRQPERACDVINEIINRASKHDLYRDSPRLLYGLIEVAMAFAKIGESEKASTLINRVVENVSAIPLSNLHFDYSGVLLECARVMGEIGNPDKELEIIKMAYRLSASRAIGRLIEKMGIDEVAAFAMRDDSPNKVEAMVYLFTRYYVDMGDMKKASDILKEIKLEELAGYSSYYKHSVLGLIAKFYSEQGNLDKALEIINDENMAHIFIVKAFIQKGDLKRAFGICKIISNNTMKFCTLMILANAIKLQDPKVASRERKRLIECLDEENERILHQKQRRDEEEKLENIITRLNDSNPEVRHTAIYEYVRLHKWKDARAIGPLEEALRKDDSGKISPLAIILNLIFNYPDISTDYTDKVVYEYLKSEATEAVETTRILANRSDINEGLIRFPKTRDIIMEFRRKVEAAVEEMKNKCKKEEEQVKEERIRVEQENGLREGLSAKYSEICQLILDKLNEALFLEADHSVTSSNGNDGYYGSVTTGHSLSMRQRMEHRLTQEILSGNLLEVEEGETIDEAKERIRTLNILVHHEVAHIVQEAREIKSPGIRGYKHLDQEDASVHANEVLVDRLGFDAARKIYVHGDGDVQFDEGTREAIAINAFLTLSKIILRNVKSGVHNLSYANIARLVAVAYEMSESENISFKTKNEMLDVIQDFKVIIFSEKNQEIVDEILRLINEYRRIFISSELKV